MSLMGGALADRADESLAPASGINADEVENLALVQVAL